MVPLTIDDVLPLEEYVGQRNEHFTAHIRYLDRYRRVRIGPRLTLLFENRQTLWFRLQEILRVARLDDPTRVQHELDWYNQLLPSRDRLQAALLISVPENAGLFTELQFWKDIDGSEIRLMVGKTSIEGRLLTNREADVSIGMAHWIEFVMSVDQRHLLSDFRSPARFRVEYRGYDHDSQVIAEDVRQSLLDDLMLSDRDP